MATYEQWNEVIYEALFPQVGGPQHVYFDVDEERLEEVAKRFEVPIPEAAVSDLAGAVRGACLRDSEVYLSGLLEPSPIPRQVAFLALSVLAAEQMESSHADHGFVASTNYYARLNSLLGLPGVGYPPGWSNLLFEACWQEFKRRLEEEERGLLSAEPGGRTRRYVWYPISQVLLSRQDRRRLRAFFKERQFPVFLSKHVTVPGFENDLLEWAHGSQLSSRAKALLVGTSRRAELIGLVRHELSHWAGQDTEVASVSRLGNNTSQAELRLDLTESGECFLYLLLRHRSSWPLSATLAPAVAGLAAVHCEDGPDAPYYSPIPLPTEHDLGCAVELSLVTDDGKRLSFNRSAQDIVVFSRELRLLNAWTSTERLSVGIESRVACRKTLTTAVRSLLAQVAAPAYGQLIEEINVGRDWVVFLNLVPQDLDIPIHDPQFACLAPAHVARAQLKNGILLRRSGRRNVFLQGFPPTVNAVGELAHTTTVLLDGIVINKVEGCVSLPRTLTQGMHQVVFGTRRLTFSIDLARSTTAAPRFLRLEGTVDAPTLRDPRIC